MNGMTGSLLSIRKGNSAALVYLDFLSLYNEVNVLIQRYFKLLQIIFKGGADDAVKIRK